MSEKEYSDLGEELAKLAVQTGLGAKQLRDLYSYIKNKPLPEVEAVVKRQIGRSMGGQRGGPRGYDIFGPRFLELMEAYKENRSGLQRILWYANMLYPYYEARPVAETPSSAERGAQVEDLEDRVEAVVRQACSRYGFAGFKLSSERDGFLGKVSLRRFQGNPRALSEELYGLVTNRFPECRDRIRFWIER